LIESEWNTTDDTSDDRSPSSAASPDNSHIDRRDATFSGTRTPSDDGRSRADVRAQRDALKTDKPSSGERDSDFSQATTEGRNDLQRPDTGKKGEKLSRNQFGLTKKGPNSFKKPEDTLKMDDMQPSDPHHMPTDITGELSHRLDCPTSGLPVDSPEE
jgi:hypothetical protein